MSTAEAVVENDKMRQKLHEFDQKHDTLIDYFAIIGFDNSQLRKLIQELEDLERGSATNKRRLLVPSLLEKFPSVDRAKVAFPPELVDFFFDMEETIWTKGEVDSYADRYLIASGLDRRRLEDHYQQEVCTGVDGTIIYITTHMFFEDLAKIQESLPINKDYLEDLNSKEDK